MLELVYDEDQINRLRLCAIPTRERAGLGARGTDSSHRHLAMYYF